MFPLLFRIATDREATVDSYAQMQGQVVVWNIVLHRQVQDWEMGQVLGRILTIDNLSRRGHILVNWCCMCCGAAESVDHLLICCPVASRIWMSIVALFGLDWVQPGTVRAVLQSWVGGRVGKRRRKAWNLAGHCLMWLMWLERNRRVFLEELRLAVWLERHLLLVVHSWLTLTVDSAVLSFVEFVEDLSS
ncbi:uncharacterized protein LOC114262245 [Camellia sinensis]|uniref:uncharacterized protein LOC114262245 n=1 Tax=Camellia sinensis TaxID=4442 RepID=UPI001035DC4F|nr:uncharacterized protein LOC114262245 [Camellia sinensis]